MAAVLIDIFISVHVRKRAVILPIRTFLENRTLKRQRILQKQMLTLMIASVGLFLITSLPLAIHKIASPRAGNLSLTIFEIISVWTALGWFQSLFYAVTIFIKILFFCYMTEVSFILLGWFLLSLSHFDIISQRIQTTNQAYMECRKNIINCIFFFYLNK